MGDVNFLFRSRVKIQMLLAKLRELDAECKFVNEILAQNELSDDEEIHSLTILTQLYDVRIMCLARLKVLINSRFKMFAENQ